MKKSFHLLVILFILPAQLIAQPGTFLLHDHWLAKRAADITIDGCEITSGSFKPEGWLEAVVPGTILTTLLHNNLIPDPFYGLNNNLIPDVYETGREYYTYWFYTEFIIPESGEDQQVWLNFRGINYFAEVFLNGKRVNTRTHEGMYLREKYNITTLLTKDRVNRLAVWVAPPDPAGNAYAGQGGDGTIGRNVTMQCTAGWDWICPMRDRNTGIWDQVSLEMTGPVDISDPYIEPRVPGVRTPGGSQAPAFVRSSAYLKNTSSHNVNGTLKINLEGKEAASVKVLLKPSEYKLIPLPEIKINNPLLWWPNGMGDHPLYKVDFVFLTDSGKESDSEDATFGLRETGNYFDTKFNAQVFTVNGQKVFIKGGNWIASDAMLRLTKERYEAEVRMHAGMNMNMIRVWGGGLTERPEFYDACDKYGILVWQDLWISGDCNGEWNDPTKKESQARRKAYPDNHDLFLESMADQVKMLRNHPGLFLWCGGNETLPPADILNALKTEILPGLDPKRLFLEMSTSSQLMTNIIGGVGDGPYGIREPETIFLERSNGFNPETGSIGIPNYEGLKKIIPENELNPPRNNRPTGSWNYHKYLPLNDFPDRYGKVKNIKDFCMKAQLVSYEQYRALQEGFNYKMWDWYSGMLVWKNQNPWSALRGFFYDYYLDYTGGYFGYMHGASPVHIQLNLNDSVVCALNQTPYVLHNVKAVSVLYDLHGKIVSEKTSSIDLKSQEKVLLGKIELPGKEDEVFFLRLMLKDDQERTVDENLYWLSNRKHSYEKLNDLKQVTLNMTSEKISDNIFPVTVSNPSDETAFFIRLKVCNSSNEQVLPAFLSENYFTLMPGESRKVEVDLSLCNIPAKQSKLKVVSSGFNIPDSEINLP
jgi:hypothetical protein